MVISHVYAILILCCFVYYLFCYIHYELDDYNSKHDPCGLLFNKGIYTIRVQKSRFGSLWKDTQNEATCSRTPRFTINLPAIFLTAKIVKMDWQQLKSFVCLRPWATLFLAPRAFLRGVVCATKKLDTTS